MPNAALDYPAFSIDEKVAFLLQHAGGNLGLNTALSQLLLEALAKAAIHEDNLHVVEQLLVQGLGVPDVGGGFIATTGRYYAAG